ncbi:alkylresorcinol/alkylpyrone synthase [Dysgonomonas alginatilytica]|uniref:Alkylresorcinol/alkylpyrone synthase n=1 Tax=Dysgonomonas alginatilytica TaxID=1605892 RepID=A0A2V3PPY2_9BACT|nr:3-oxoacyl-[acyl-carrier-protein] synthase III C-terminal domain-containing protein [Dysgonomonas alginatilytica]PXV65517.1 alkylresorcinol/alkylpyrone synthase [Dysgonomonas alginatilytica]
MPSLAAISKIDFPFKTSQQDVKEYAKNLFSASFPEVERMMSAFDNTEIATRNLCKSLDYYSQVHTFQEQNLEYIRLCLEYSVEAIEKCISSAQINKDDITDIIFVSTTGLATPSMDALIINKMRLNQHINHMAVFGLGCGGGVAGYAKACTLAKANADAVVLLVAAELCSLTFLRDDFSKSNFIGASLFADGVAACLITGDNHTNKTEKEIAFIDSQSKLYFDTLDIMGWDFGNNGFKVLFSSGIPSIIAKNVNNDVTSFLAKNQLKLSDIKNFIFHPGGKKVLTAYQEALAVEGDFLKNTREIMKGYGNMSSSTVLYVLERFFTEGFENGHSLMMSMGPGFSCEMVLLNSQQ